MKGKAAMSEYDFRQYRLMLDNAMVPISSMNGLRKTIDNLNALLCSIEHKDSEWSSLFMHQWWILEDLYAINRYENSNILTEAKIEEINKVLKIITELINQKIQQQSDSIEEDN